MLLTSRHIISQSWGLRKTCEEHGQSLHFTVRKLKPRRGKQLLSQDHNFFPGESHIKSSLKVSFVIRFVLSSKNRVDILKFSIIAGCNNGAGAAACATMGQLGLGKSLQDKPCLVRTCGCGDPSLCLLPLTACGGGDKLTWSDFLVYQLLAL